jgi:hypothetical protein
VVLSLYGWVLVERPRKEPGTRGQWREGEKRHRNYDPCLEAKVVLTTFMVSKYLPDGDRDRRGGGKETGERSVQEGGNHRPIHTIR